MVRVGQIDILRSQENGILARLMYCVVAAKVGRSRLGRVWNCLADLSRTGSVARVERVECSCHI